ncbi:hypothetical protein ZIOFF_027346 [Zingiber officinale]|uniref:RNA methyltransferase n=1 Tax=Zingiber officinale TaxID=94328 RepID=A0A8J5GLB8_ZINOF|nr:hypothetical protein ZIOFF_027346 [Zingiber officinale]
MYLLDRQRAGPSEAPVQLRSSDGRHKAKERAYDRSISSIGRKQTIETCRHAEEQLSPAEQRNTQSSSYPTRSSRWITDTRLGQRTDQRKGFYIQIPINAVVISQLAIFISFGHGRYPLPFPSSTTSFIRGVGRRHLLVRRGLPERRCRLNATELHPVQPALERSSVRGRCAHALGRARRPGRPRSYLLAHTAVAPLLVTACFSGGNEGRCHALKFVRNQVPLQLFVKATELISGWCVENTRRGGRFEIWPVGCNGLGPIRRFIITRYSPTHCSPSQNGAVNPSSLGALSRRAMKNDAATENDHVRLRDGSDSTGDGVRRKKRKEGKKGKGEEKRKKRKEKKPTVSIAVAGSIIDNAQSLELATLLAGQVARAATIFRIDEVVVFGNKASADDDSIHPVNNEESQSGALFLVRILQYLETPQYLRRRLFPMHKSLKFVGLLPPLDAPHHLRKHEWCPFREGVTLDANPSNSEGTSVDVGLNKMFTPLAYITFVANYISFFFNVQECKTILVEGVLEPGKRVTVAMGENRSTELDGFKKVVSSSQRDQIGIYWGYKVRYASNLSNVFKNCSYKHGYDHIIGTSEHGLVVNSSELEIPSFRHFLIVFGGLAGLEESIKEDDSLKGKDVHDVFNSYLNTCPLQGSRTIRTEEAIFISLQFFQDPIKRAQQQCNGK